MMEIARAVARFVLPSVCLACQRRAAEEFFRGGVCAHCWRALPILDTSRCSRCDEAIPESPEGATCGRCLLDPPDFERLRAAAPYQGSARAILLAFKFQGADYLATRLAAAMAGRLEAPVADAVVAVPSTRRSRKARGYHAAEVLAAAVARRLGLPLLRRGLVKVRAPEVPR